MIHRHGGNSGNESRKIPIDGRHGDERKERDAPTREIEGTCGTRTRRELGRREKESKKDGLPRSLEGWNYGSKNRNQSHWLKAAWPREYLARWSAGATWIVREYLSAFTFDSLVLSFSRLYSCSFLLLVFYLFLPLLLLLPPSPPSPPPLALAGLPTFRGGPPWRSCYHLYPWPVPHRYARRVVSRKFAENAFFVENVERRDAPLPNSFPR